jgi:hypothetical protein
MNKDERTHFENHINRLISENQKIISESEKNFKLALNSLHNQELVIAQDMKRIEGKLDIYCQQLYRNSFYGGIAWRVHVISEFLKKKTLLRQKPILKRFEVKEGA